MVTLSTLLVPTAGTCPAQAQVAPPSAEDAKALNSQGDALYNQGKYSEAEPLYRKALDINRAVLGENHPDTATSYSNVASNLGDQGRYREAEPLFRKALGIYRAVLGENHPYTSTSYDNVALSLSKQGRYGEAESLYRKALDINRAVLSENHPYTSTSYDNVAISLSKQGRYGEAEPLYRKALDIRRATLGENHLDTATSYNNLALNLNAQGRSAEAEPLFRQVLEIRRAIFGENHRDTGESYNNLAANLNEQGRFGEAEPLYGKGLNIRRKALGENHRDTATSYNEVAFNLNAQGRYSEAGPLFRKALDIYREVLGENHPDTATSYSNVASNLVDQGRYREAEPLFRKALDIWRAALGENHPKTALGYSNVAFYLDAQGRYGEAEPLDRKALEIRRATLGENDSDTAASYNNVAFNLTAQGRYGAAEPMYRRALEIQRALLGENNRDTATSYNNLAANLNAQGRHGEAEPLFQKALDILRAVIGENHRDTARSYNNVANNISAQGRYVEAETVSAKAVESARAARLRASGQGPSSQSQTNFEKPVSQTDVYFNYLAISSKFATKVPGEQARLQSNAFRVAQDIIGSASAQAMGDAAVRASATTDALAAVAREEQDLAALAGQIDKRLLAALGRSDTVQAGQLRTDYEATLAKLALVEARIDKDFPTYRELISPKPLDLADAQKALAPGEGLLVLVAGDDAVYSFAVTPDAVAWNRVVGDAKTILKQVAILRCNVDPDTCSDQLNKAFDALPATKAEQDGYQRFDLVTAHALYAALIAPVETALKGVSRLYVTSSGSLGDLPLGMLVTAPPAANADLADPDVLLNAAWLNDRYALTSLPAVSALRLRTMAKASLKPSTAFRGYGNPVLAPTKGEDRGGTYYRGAGADGIRLGDPDRLRTMPSLPGTKTELLAMAGLYPLGTNALTMGAGATEAAVKRDPLLRQTNIIAFATHGLLPSPGKGMDEPGLVFTPPKVASADDDGILTASEASQLSFLADWVILSACNTASTASGAGGSDSLSALARAFLYAGAHALLASHWQVSDKATAALTVETLTARRDNPKLTRAQALQQAMHSVRTGKRPNGSAVKGWDQSWLHPSAWAPFSHIANSDE